MRFLVVFACLLVGCAARPPASPQPPTLWNAADAYGAWARGAAERAEPAFRSLVHDARFSSDLDDEFYSTQTATDAWRKRAVAGVPGGLVAIDDDDRVFFVPAGRGGDQVTGLTVTEHHLLVQWSDADYEHSFLEDRDPFTLSPRRVLTGLEVEEAGPGWIAFARGDEVVVVADETTLAPRFEREAAGGSSSEPTWVPAPDGDTFVVGGQLLDAHTGRVRAELHTQFVGFSADGARLAASVDGHTKLYDTRTGVRLAETDRCTTHGAPAFSPDGTRLVVGPTPSETLCLLSSRDLGVEFESPRLPSTGRVVAFCSPPDAAWSPDGTRLRVTKRSDGLDAVFTYPALSLLTTRATSTRVTAGKVEYREDGREDGYPGDERERHLAAAFCGAAEWPVPRAFCGATRGL